MPTPASAEPEAGFFAIAMESAIRVQVAPKSAETKTPFTTVPAEPRGSWMPLASRTSSWPFRAAASCTIAYR
jgi:hypothetical protein